MKELVKSVRKKIVERKAIMTQCFLVSVCIELAMGIWHHAGHTVPGSRFILWILFFQYLLTVFLNQFEKKEWCLFLLVEILGCILYFESGINTGIKFPVFVMACKEMDTRKIVQYIFYTMCFMFTLIIGLNRFFSIGASYLTDIRPERGINGIRYMFGFTNPNVCQFMAVMILMFGLYLYQNKMRNVWIVIACILFMILGYYTNSLTGILMGFFVVVEFGMVHFLSWKRWNTALLVAQCGVLALMVLISIGAALKIELPLLDFVNRVISGRMTQLGTANNEGYTLLGYANNWKLFSTRYHKNFYDMGYIQIFYYYGIILGSLYLYMIIKGMIGAFKCKNVKLQIMLLTCSMYALVEALFFTNYLTFDLFAVIAILSIWEGKKRT